MHGPNFETADDAAETVVSTVDLREMDSLSEEITTVLFEHADLAPDQVGPLGEQIDTDALDSLFMPDAAEGGRPNAHLSFRFEGWHVDVDASGYFQLRRVGPRRRE